MTEGNTLIGRTIGKLKILDRLGHGQTSTIFRAFYEPLQKEVAVKVLKQDMKLSEEIRQKFLNEARALAKLDHENIVKVFDVVEVGEYLLIIMELLNGRDLWQVLKDDGPIEAAEAVRIATQAASALRAAHQQGIVHRDVKPANLMLVGRRQAVKLVDFGLATEGQVAGMAGTPHYMSPEQIQGKRVEEKSDVYSLGATLFHILTGRPPYPGKHRKEILEKHLAGQLPSVSRVGREMEVPKALDPVVKRMMAPVPGYRPNTRDLVQSLEELNLLSRSRRRSPRAARAASRKSKASPLLLLGVAAAVVGIVAVLTVVLLSKDVRPPPVVNPTNGSRTDTGVVKPIQPGIGNRADTREAREQDAHTAFQRAEAFLGQNFDKYDQAIAEYRKVWDGFAETSWGLKAREKITALEGQLDAVKNRTAEQAATMAREKAREDLDKDLPRLLARYEFMGARKKLEDFMDAHGERSSAMEHFNRLERAAQCLDALATEVNSKAEGNPLEVSMFKPRAPDGATMKAADIEGFTLVIGTKERRETWSYFQPNEMARLLGRQPWLKDPMKLFLMYCMLTEMGMADDGQMYLEQAKTVDRRGIVEELMKALKGK